MSYSWDSWFCSSQRTLACKPILRGESTSIRWKEKGVGLRSISDIVKSQEAVTSFASARLSPYRWRYDELGRLRVNELHKISNNHAAFSMLPVDVEATSSIIGARINLGNRMSIYCFPTRKNCPVLDFYS